jgi:hypothetical protein
VLPPVTCTPSAELMYALPAGAASTRIAPTATSSSSASSVGSAVYTPWPISERSARNAIEPSVSILSHAFACTGDVGLLSVAGPLGVSLQPGS